MKILAGYQFFPWNKEQKLEAVYLNTDLLINPHMIILGASGVGKSYTLKSFMAQAMAQSAETRFIIYDVHGDLDVPGESEVLFSEQSPYGLNPFIVDPDPHYGGVNRCIRNFLRIVNQTTSPRLGVSQESVMRQLLLDVFMDFGFDPNDADTWWVSSDEQHMLSKGRNNRLYLEIPFDQKDKAKALHARWDQKMSCWYIQSEMYNDDFKQWPLAHRKRKYPSLQDVYNYAYAVYQEKFMGSDEKAIRELQAVNKLSQQYQKKLIQKLKRKSHSDAMVYDEDEELAIDKAKEKAKEAYNNYVERIQTGMELDTLMKYDSPDTLKTVLIRLENILNTGVFKSEYPPFDPNAKIWRFNLSALEAPEKRMLVYIDLQHRFSQAMKRGICKGVKEILVMDELGLYTSAADEKGEGIVGRIASEARKFGLGLWAATQNPAQVPETLISSVGTKVLLGIDEGFWDSAVRKFKIEPTLLKFIQPKQTIGIQLKEAGSLKLKWQWVILNPKK